MKELAAPQVHGGGSYFGSRSLTCEPFHDINLLRRREVEIKFNVPLLPIVRNVYGLTDTFIIGNQCSKVIPLLTLQKLESFQIFINVVATRLQTPGTGFTFQRN